MVVSNTYATQEELEVHCASQMAAAFGNEFPDQDNDFKSVWFDGAQFVLFHKTSYVTVGGDAGGATVSLQLFMTYNSIPFVVAA